MNHISKWYYTYLYHICNIYIKPLSIELESQFFVSHKIFTHKISVKSALTISKRLICWYSFRYEVALGTSEGSASLVDWTDVGYVNETVLTNLAIPAGTVIHAAVRGYNRAGLHNISVSNFVSPIPTVTIIDGLKSEDVQFLGDLSSMSAQWFPADNCPLVEAFWDIYRVDGLQLMSQVRVDTRNSTLYTDTVQLVEGSSYINVVTTVDILNRTAIGRSNGVTIGFIKPDPAEVRDGSIVQGEDFRYQEPERRFKKFDL